jgi:hypothetical protein
MALTLATELANYAAGIGTQGATLKVDSANKRVGVGTTNPQGPEGSLQVGTGITFFGNTGIISAIGGKFSGDFTVGGTLTYEDVQNVNSSGVGTFSGGINVVGGGLTVTGVSTFFSRVSIADSIVHTGDIDTSLRFPAADTFTVETGGSEAIRVDSSQRLILGATSAFDSGSDTLLQVASTGGARFALARNDTSTADGDSIGRIRWYGNDSDGNYDECARIEVIADADHASDSKPSALIFRTTAVSAEDSTERVRITAAGNVSIQNDSGKFTVGAGDDLQIYHDGSNSYIDDTGTGRLNIRGNTGVSLRNYSDSEQFINCYTNGTVELFYDNSKKFETTPGGTITAGINTSGGFRATGNNTPSSGQGLEMFCPDTSSSQIQSFDRTNGETDKLIIRGNPIELKDSSNTVRLEVNPAGVNITGIATATSLFEGSSRVATAGKAVAMALVFG